jgi:hypothetical protein
LEKFKGLELETLMCPNLVSGWTLNSFHPETVLLNNLAEFVMKKTAISILIIVLWICPGLAGDNIYIWTDKNGVRRFSDQPPPRDVKHYGTIEVRPSEQEESGESRPGYGGSAENVKSEAEQRGQESVNNENSGAAEEKREAESDMKARIEAERQRLNEKIDAINKRPLSRTYNHSFKQARIDEIQKELDRLKNSPEEYFKNQ